MKCELPYFSIEGAFGGSQEWFTHDWWMKKGGCAAVTATDCSLYFSLYKVVLFHFSLIRIEREKAIRH